MKNIIPKIISDIFYISLITFIVFFVLELLKEGLISNYFDLNLFILWTILFGFLAIIMKKYDRPSHR